MNLPEPDSFGNHWFGLKTDHNAPAILRSAVDGKYLVRIDGEAGFAKVTTPEGPKLLRVPTPEVGLEAIEMWRRGKERNRRKR